MQTTSAGIYATGIDPGHFIAATPLGVWNNNTYESRDLILETRPSGDGSQILIIAKKTDGSIWASKTIVFWAFSLDGYIG